MRMSLRNKRGYSLVELMVVITIMAILAAASTPVFHGYIQKAKASSCLAECRAIYMAAESCLSTFDESMDIDELEDEIRRMTSLDIEILEDVDEYSNGTYGLSIYEGRGGEWFCDAIVCFVDDEPWLFDAVTGEFNKLN